MADNMDLRGAEDRNRIASDEDWEIDYMIEKTGASRKEIADAIKAVGNSREKVEAHLLNMKK